MNVLNTITLMITGELIVDAVLTLVGIFAGSMAALALDRWNEQRQLRRQAKTVLHSLLQELRDNYKALQNAKPAYANTPWGRSFYLSTIAWETAGAGGDLPDIIGGEMADAIASQYALFVRIRYHVDLLTRLWFAPADIPGYEEIRAGFRQAILDAMKDALGQQANMLERIKAHPSVEA
ncbi:MAG: hypothetical protein JW850_02735 [Thermoflexales bacterium]|nr:hypothetical protein [Thermoflexales bacterium]